VMRINVRDMSCPKNKMYQSRIGIPTSSRMRTQHVHGTLFH
jgi:hypothetical protein